MLFAPDIHHRRSIRLPGFDYATPGACFVTIRVQRKACLFGDIDDGELTRNEAGQMVDAVWEGMSAQYPNLTLDEHIVMPDHFHGIILLNPPKPRRGEPCVRPDCGPGEYVGNMGEHMENMCEHEVRPYGGRANGTLDGSVGRVVQAFKSLTTNQYIRGVKNHGWPPFAGRLWQRNYYERVIRSDMELQNIREYIRNNPNTWQPDTEHQNPYE